ncbi:helix-turn-helix transcriptional regulator [Methylobacterium brachiatum]|uniref:helix-turn-helix transcriptional regulator n=1 Tax=Methylobacterium brachiatum TaxID=269660 RepID=UPI00352284D0|nr:helix-turn-helix domain-containing protein [Methylobacterium brachiatum]
MTLINIQPEQVRAARAMLGWSQDDLAARIGLSRRSLINYEHGIHSAKEETLKKMASIFREAGIEFTRTASGAIGLTLSEEALLESRVHRRRPAP